MIWSPFSSSSSTSMATSPSLALDGLVPAGETATTVAGEKGKALLLGLIVTMVPWGWLDDGADDVEGQSLRAEVVPMLD